MLGIALHGPGLWVLIKGELISVFLYKWMYQQRLTPVDTCRSFFQWRKLGREYDIIKFYDMYMYMYASMVKLLGTWTNLHLSMLAM